MVGLKKLKCVLCGRGEYKPDFSANAALECWIRVLLKASIS